MLLQCPKYVDQDCGFHTTKVKCKYYTEMARRNVYYANLHLAAKYTRFHCVRGKRPRGHDAIDCSQLSLSLNTGLSAPLLRLLGASAQEKQHEVETLTEVI